MRATSTPPDTATSNATVDAPPAPFALEFVTITKQEHIELKMAACHWQTLHRKAVIVLVPPHLEHVLVVRWRQQVMSGRLGHKTAVRMPPRQNTLRGRGAKLREQELD